MITHRLLTDDAIVVVEPAGPLSADDFKGLTESVDAFLEQHGALGGLLIHVREFPGWEDFEGMIDHIKFVKSHHEQIQKIALVSDSKMAAMAPKLAGHFISAEVKSFGFDDYEGALSWIRGA